MSSERESVTSKRATVCEAADLYPPLPRWRKLLYALTGFSRGIVWAVVQLFLPTFLLEVAQLRWFDVMLVIILKQVVDAITDPLVGRLSDLTHTPIGRRKPWTLACAMPVLGLWILLWYSPGYVDDYAAWKTLYYIALLIVWTVFYTCMNMPLSALLPDAAPTYNERTSVVVYVETASKLGSMVATFLWSSTITWFPSSGSHDVSDDSSFMDYDYVKGYAVVAMGTGPIIILTAILGSFGVPERPVALTAKPRLYYSSAADTDYDTDGARTSLLLSDDGAEEDGLAEKLGELGRKEGFVGVTFSFLHDVVDLLRFRPFLWVSVMNLLGLLSVTLFVNNFYLYMKYVIVEESQTNWVLLALQGSIVISLFFWSALAYFINKRYVFIIGTIPWMITLACLFFVPEGDLWAVYFLIIVRGFSAGVAHLIPASMLPDVIQLDELRSGKRREGLCYSLFLLMLKGAMAFSQSTSVLALGVAGYIPPSKEDGFEYPKDQPEAVIWTLRVLVSWCPLVVLTCALLCTYLYHRSILKAQQALNLYTYSE